MLFLLEKSNSSTQTRLPVTITVTASFFWGGEGGGGLSKRFEVQKGFAYFKVNCFVTGICQAIRQMSYLFGAEINEPLEFDLIVGQ